MNQLTFLSKIDRAATQSKLESLLEEIRLNKQFGMVREEMKITPSYEVRYHGPTNTVGNPLEDVALENIKRSEREQYLKDMSFRIDQF
ncbi:ArpU family transcriptional regulator, partial [Bacillus thuringiensis]